MIARERVRQHWLRAVNNENKTNKNIHLWNSNWRSLPLLSI